MLESNVGAGMSQREMRAFRKKYYLTACGIFLVCAVLLTCVIVVLVEPPSSYGGIFDMVVKDIEGHAHPLSQYHGKVILVVNVASECGYTISQYDGLQRLYDRQHESGLEILAFPSNTFQQETGSNHEIQDFVRNQLLVSLPLMEKVEVNGASESPVYTFLKSYLPGDIKWNFEKFLLDKNGFPAHRYETAVDPMQLEKDVVNLLYRAG